MRVAVLLVAIAAVVVGVSANGDAAVAAVTDVNLDEIDRVDSSVFNADASPVANTPLEQAAAAVVSARDADLDRDTETVVSLASESAGTGGEDQTMYSFRAMREATAVAGSSVTEKASETHAAAMRILNHGNTISAEDMFAEINREQQILVAKRSLVARQKQSIADSEDSLGRLKRLIGENKKILRKNEHALKRASEDLLRLLHKYQSKLSAGLTAEVGGTADTPLGVPVRSRPHQRAAFTKWAEQGKRTVDTTKSKAALAASNAKAKAAPSAKPAAKPAAAAAPAAAKKAKFAQVHDEDEAEADAEDADESEAETEESSEAAEESESEADSEESSEAEADAEAEDESEEESSEESEASLIEAKAAAHEDAADDESYDPQSVDRAAALPGLAPPPHLYNPEDDTFV